MFGALLCICGVMVGRRCASTCPLSLILGLLAAHIPPETETTIMLSELVIRAATPDDAEEIGRVMVEARASLANPDWFVISNPKRLAGKLRGDCFGWVVDAPDASGAEQTVAYYLFQQPEADDFPEETGLGADELSALGIPESEFGMGLVLSTVAVLPEYRGLGLQRFLSRLGEAEGRARGCRHCFATVHPDNRYSRDNFLNEGYRVVATKEMFQGIGPSGMLMPGTTAFSDGRGLLRNVMYKEIK